VQIVLSVDGPPPERAHPGHSADRHSPNADPLVRAAEERIASAPGPFPLREPLGITVVFGSTKGRFDHYDPIDPIIEILVDAGMIADERLTRWAQERQDPAAGDTYTVILEPAEQT
jgi:hypothetical protein